MATLEDMMNGILHQIPMLKMFHILVEPLQLLSNGFRCDSSPAAFSHNPLLNWLG